MPRGGARPNSGPPKGAKYAPTIAKEQAREVARALITAQLEPLINAQIANAQGLRFLVVRDKATGKFVRVTEGMARIRQSALKEGEPAPQDGLEPALKDTEEIIEVWEKDPSVQAFTDLLNRALDKPKEQAMEMNLNVTELGARLDAAREAARKRNQKP